MKKLLLAVLVCALVLLAATATAGAKTPTLKSLAKTVAALQKKVAAQAKTITRLNTIVAGHTQTLANAASLLAIAPYVSLHSEALNGVAGPNVVFQGCNVHVRSSTDEYHASGLGNLIVGWDDPPLSLPSQYRTGSNNLVVGVSNNFTSVGGFVAGGYNEISGIFCSVLGDGNVASNNFASVSGGILNRATGVGASVSGGFLNTAANYCASVSGGKHNSAAGQYSSVSGGGGDTPSTGLAVSADLGWAAGNTATPGTGTAKFIAP